MRAGRVLSRRTRQSFRTRSVLDGGVGGGLRDEVIQIISGVVGPQDLHVCSAAWHVPELGMASTALADPDRVIVPRE